MRFSIITVTLNAEKYLEEALHSVGVQNFSSFEHILWDGGSEDRTLDIASRFSHVSIHRGKDSGIADAMNQGACQAKGDFLLHLHADDRLPHAQVLQMLDTCLRQHPSIRWIFGGTRIISEKSDPVRTMGFTSYSEKKLRKYNILSHPSTWVARELFQQAGGFDASLLYCMDYDLWLRLASLEKPFVFPGILADFREHHGSASFSHPEEVADEAYRVRKRYVKWPWQKWKSYRTWKKRKKRIRGQSDAA